MSCSAERVLPRIANRNARGYVQRRDEFTGSNLYGRWERWSSESARCYNVYSYGDHFPIYIWDDEVQRWFGNEDKYSPTTSKHQGQCMPTDRDNITWCDTGMMQTLLRHGFRVIAAQRITGAPETDWQRYLQERLMEQNKKAVLRRWFRNEEG